MSTQTHMFDRYLKNKKLCLIGTGVSHRELIPMFLNGGYDVTVRDRRSPEELGEVYESFTELGARFVTGEDYLENIDEDVIFRTPGLSFNHPALTAARAAGRVVTSETEMFFDLAACPTFAVTGSDGKTTTTTLIAKLLEAAGYNVLLGGNIGAPLLTRVGDTRSERTVAVVELSSFQLLSMRVAPDVAVLLNITPNHLDVHADMEEYILSKTNIFAHQKAFSRTVLGLDNQTVGDFLPRIRGEALGFSRVGKPLRGCYINAQGDIFLKDGEDEMFIVNKCEIKLPGEHNVENFLAAVAATAGYVGPEHIVSIARSFGGVEHRLEHVRKVLGADWYNDSIATSPTRAVAALRSFDRKIILIAGGYDKNIPFEPLVPDILSKVKLIILAGPAADKIEAALNAHPDRAASELKVLRAQNFADCVRLAAENACEGDIVSLSPACASFDEFNNFEERGRRFKQLVRDLSDRTKGE